MTQIKTPAATPLLSVVTITLNDRDGLIRTVESLKSQTNTHVIEHIIVDGLSSYDIGATLKMFDWPHLLHQGKDAGLYDAMNRGLALSNGEYVLFLNSGDILANDEVVDQIQIVLRDSAPHFLFGDSLEKQLNGELQFKPSRNIKSLPYGMITHHQAMVFRRSILVENGIEYNLNYPIAADYDFVVRHVAMSETIEHLPVPICIFEQGGISFQKRDQARLEQFRVRRAAYGSTVFATLVFTAQWALWTFRSLFPSAYWAIKRRFG